MGGQGDSSSEKTEKPTPKRLREARKKGQIFKSKDMEAASIFLVMFATIAFSKNYATLQFRNLMESAFRFAERSHVDFEDMYDIGVLGLWTMVKVCMPILASGFFTAFIVGFLQVGPLFSLEPVTPDMNKLNAIENLKNMFKLKTFVELIKNIIKIAAIFLIAYLVLKGMLGPFLMTVTTTIENSATLGQEVIVRFMIRFLILFVVVAVIDYMLQRKDYMKNLMMSKDEVKREYKEDEGDPHIKGQRKQIHMEMAMGDAKQGVKGADAVVTNPTHLAIAIKYDKKEMHAPQVTAKGQRIYADYIRELAKDYDVPIIRNIPLAWALIELEVGDEVPEHLYQAVAEILSFVYKMKEKQEA